MLPEIVYRARLGPFHSPLTHSHTALLLAVAAVLWTHVILSTVVHGAMLDFALAITTRALTAVLKMGIIQLVGCH